MNKRLILLTCFLLSAAICFPLTVSCARAEDYVNQEYGIQFAIPAGYQWRTQETRSVDPDGSTKTFLGSCRMELLTEPGGHAGDAVMLLAVFDYPQGHIQESLTREDYVKSSVTPQQKIIGGIEKVSVSGFDGVSYVLKETDPQRYGTAMSLVTLVWLTKRRVLEFTATTLPQEYFDFKLPSFKSALYNLEIKR